ncbi:DUF1684 domain-containing protein [bacterium]|nr:DUF1684 domain-containing protein [bacterium]
MTETTYLDEIRSYQGNMDAQLRTEDGWLTLAGLHWLSEGQNKIGSGPENHIPLPTDAPTQLGTLEFTPPQVILHLEDGQTVLVEGKELSGSIPLESDINRNPTIVQLGPVSFFIIQRGARTGVRVKQVNHPNRLNFPGRVWWPVDESLRVEAQIIPYKEPKIITIPDILGDATETQIHNALHFTYNGQSATLDALPTPTGQFYLIFHDLSCGKGSYPPGRFLLTEIPEPEEDKVIIDFNKAYNPPCAFTSFATCPFPPRENYLPFPIQAGERYRPNEANPH